MPDQRRIRPRSHGKSEGVDEQALSGARLSGQDVEARLEGNPYPVDQGQIMNAEVRQPTAGHGDRLWIRDYGGFGRFRPGGDRILASRPQVCTRAGHDGSNSDF